MTREDRLLDLAGVERPEHEQLRAAPGAARSHVDDARAVLLGIGLEVGRVQDERLRPERRELVARSASMNIVFANSAWYGCAVTTRTPIRCAGIGAGPRVDHVQRVGGAEMRGRPCRAARRNCASASFWLTSPHQMRSVRRRLVDEELVLGRAAGEVAGVDDERPAFREPPVAARERMRVEQRGRRISIDAAGRVDPVRREIHGGRAAWSWSSERLLQAFRPGRSSAKRVHGTDSAAPPVAGELSDLPVAAAQHGHALAVGGDPVHVDARSSRS